jgi:hypothetical protein
MDTNTNYVEPTWLTKMRKLVITLFMGFCLGSFATNITYTYQLQQDCELLKQFRVGKLAYTCIIK